MCKKGSKITAYTHEHHMYMEVDKQLLTCFLCNVSYCERCGKEVPTHTLNCQSPGVRLFNNIFRSKTFRDKVAGESIVSIL